MAILNPINPYEKWDQARDIIQKNKVNILNLYELLDDVATEDDLKALVSLVGDYATDDPTGLLDENLSVIANVGVVASNLSVALKRISAAETAINTLDSRVSRIENDGIGNWIGTYASSGNDDSSTLPTPSQEQDRAMTEYATGDTLKYQEWKYLNSAWGKIGTELDSHIHSQGGGISLADVAQQQDPKIERVLGAFIPALDITTEAELFNKAEAHKTYELKDPSDGHNIGKFSVYSKTSGLVVLFGIANDDKAGRPIMITAMINVQTMFKMVLVNLESGDPTEDNHVVNKRWFLANQNIKDITHLTTQDEVYNAVEIGKLYSMLINGVATVVTVGQKNTLLADLHAISGKAVDTATAYSARVKPGINTTTIWILSKIIVKDPIEPGDATTKKYVDDEIAKIPAGNINKPLKKTSGLLKDFYKDFAAISKAGNTVIYVHEGRSLYGPLSYDDLNLEWSVGTVKLDIDIEFSDVEYLQIGLLYI